MKKICIMSVDIDPPLPSCPKSEAKEGLNALLETFKRHNIKATFFVTAILSHKLKDLLGEIIEQGHEIACHGLRHDPNEVSLSTKDQIRNIALATNLIEQVTGMKPLGFRAPLFKVNKKCWVALHENEYLYDSSVVCSIFYNFSKITYSSKPYLLINPDVKNRKPLIEIPVSVNPFLPFPLGGAYLRIFGRKWLELGIRMNFLSGAPATLYIHPKDVSQKTRGYFWYTNVNVKKCIYDLDMVLSSIRSKGAIFLKSCDLAKLFLKEKFNFY